MTDAGNSENLIKRLAERQNGERLGFLSLAYCGFLRLIRAAEAGRTDA